MKKRGITNISFESDSNKLKIEYNGSRTETLEDSKLTKEQREIKEFFQNNKEKSLSRESIEKMVNKDKEEKGKNNFPTGPVIGVVAVVLVISLVGFLIYYNKPRKRTDY